MKAPGSEMLCMFISRIELKSLLWSHTSVTQGPQEYPDALPFHGFAILMMRTSEEACCMLEVALVFSLCRSTLDGAA